MNIFNKIHKYDSQLDYISGYENCKSKVKCKCNRCGNVFERAYTTITRKNIECGCPHCQLEIARIKRANALKGISPIHITLEQRLEHFIEILNERLPDWKYIKGYTGCESKVLLECKHCGSLVYRTASIIRASHYKKFKCNNCNTLKHKIDKYKSNKIEQYNKSNIKYLDRLLRYFKSHTIYIKECKICNSKYETKYNNKKYCDNCKAYDKHHSSKSLKKLYEKENGICYICNKQCDYNDYIVKDNTIICGNNYPSIDHVIPLCKGGTDDWNNLRLAHRICNSYKSLEDKA